MVVFPCCTGSSLAQTHVCQKFNLRSNRIDRAKLASLFIVADARMPLPPPHDAIPLYQIIGHTKGSIEEILDGNPPNLQAFMGHAEEIGMLR